MGTGAYGAYKALNGPKNSQKYVLANIQMNAKL